MNYTFFERNEAGPVVSKRQTQKLVNSLYLNGGFNSTIENSTFEYHRGLLHLDVEEFFPALNEFMFGNYFRYTQAPTIKVDLIP